MARDSSGNHTLPAGNPVVTQTAISSSVHNATLSDVSDEITDSLSRTGKGGMLSALREVDGTVGSPAYSFTNETGTGMYRANPNWIGWAIGGVIQAALQTVGFFVDTIGSLTGTTIRVMGTMDDGASAVGVAIDNSKTLSTTGAKIASFRNNTAEKAYVDKDGAFYAAATETFALSAETGWTLGTQAFLNRSGGIVTLSIQATRTTGGGSGPVVLPSGLRPLDTLTYVPATVTVNATGKTHPAVITITAVGDVGTIAIDIGDGNGFNASIAENDVLFLTTSFATV